MSHEIACIDTTNLLFQTQLSCHGLRNHLDINTRTLLHGHTKRLNRSNSSMPLETIQIAVIAMTVGFIVLVPTLYLLTVAMRPRPQYPAFVDCTCGGCVCERSAYAYNERKRIEFEVLQREIPRPPRTSTTIASDNLVRMLMASGNNVVGRSNVTDAGRAEWELNEVVVKTDGIGYSGAGKNKACSDII
jgi:hypothetical protein